MVELRASVETIRGIGPRRGEALAEAGIRTVEDLLLTLPFRYEDRSRFARIAELTPGVRATVTGRIAASLLRRTRVRGFTIFQASVEDESGILTCLWYNQPYLKDLLKEGRSVVLFGEAVLPGRGKPVVQYQNPQFEILGDDPERIHTGRIVPIYRKLGDLSPRRLRGILHDLLRRLPGEIPDPLPPDLTRRLDLPPRVVAFREVHFPGAGTDPSLLAAGRTRSHRRLALEELLALQVALAGAREARRRRKAPRFPTALEAARAGQQILPFRLTGAQERALAEILGDLARPSPMCRLLQGEVGSGKTVVALLGAMAVMEGGCQVALMVPTEILAEQHLRSLERLLARTRFRPALLTAGVPSAERRSTLAGVAKGSVDLVVGTHALLQEAVCFRQLGLVIVDEQHRFGVRQRAQLQEKGGGHPHLLLMTATPIPRSLALAFYGDMEVSVLDEIPPGRGSVRTVLRKGEDRSRLYAFIRREAGEGRRTAIVYPLIRELKGRDLRSAVREAETLARGPLAGVPMGLLHGRMSPEERSQVMADFASGKVQVLITTTVVEVGIDVPEASVMVVEHAERFGLSQLHQLRGRVGRGPAASWCILIPGEPVSPDAEARLRVLASTSSGFELARKDLELRGPGELRGFRQSGDPGLRVADLVRDADLLDLARQAALSITGALMPTEPLTPAPQPGSLPEKETRP